MRNITFLLVLLYLYLSSIHAQSPGFRTFDQSSGTIGGVQTMPTNAIADDFGPRNLAKTYWHGGTDFNTSQGAGEVQRWWMIVSPQAGIIADFDRLTHGVAEYKYGLVNVTDDEGNGSHAWAFGHVFDKSSQFYDKFNHRVVLDRCEKPNIDKWGLYLNMKDANNQVITKTYGQIAGATLKVNGVNYTTTNIVNTTDPFLPLGNSVQYCRNQNVGNHYFLIDYHLDCLNCQDSCDVQGPLMILVRPSGTQGDTAISNLKLNMPALQNRSQAGVSDSMYFPNPFQKGINLAVNSELNIPASLQVWDSFGKLVLSKILRLYSNQNVYYIDDTERLASGVYVFVLSYGEGRCLRRVIKLE